MSSNARDTATNAVNADFLTEAERVRGMIVSADAARAMKGVLQVVHAREEQARTVGEKARALEVENASLKQELATQQRMTQHAERQLHAKTDELALVQNTVRKYVDLRNDFKELQKERDGEHFKKVEAQCQVGSLKSTIGELKEKVNNFRHQSVRWEKSFGVEKKAKEIWKKRVSTMAKTIAQQKEEIARAKQLPRAVRALESHNSEGAFWTNKRKASQL